MFCDSTGSATSQTFREAADRAAGRPRVADADAAALKDRTVRVAKFDSGDREAAVKAFGEAAAALLKDSPRVNGKNARVLEEECLYYRDQGCYRLAIQCGGPRERIKFMCRKVQEYLAKPVPKVEARKMVVSAAKFIHGTSRRAAPLLSRRRPPSPAHEAAGRDLADVRDAWTVTPSTRLRRPAALERRCLCREPEGHHVLCGRRGPGLRGLSRDRVTSNVQL